MTLDTIGVTRATLLTAQIALNADEMRYEHLLHGLKFSGGEYSPTANEYREALVRIRAALREINTSLNT
jgi:hypothetical protein